MRVYAMVMTNLNNPNDCLKGVTVEMDYPNLRTLVEGYILKQGLG
jgi:hypothetical protein